MIDSIPNAQIQTTGKCGSCGVACAIKPGDNECAACGEHFLIIMPQSGPQTAFLNSRDINIVGYGGAAGGGKTYALLLDPVQDLAGKHFNGVIFRRESTQITNQGGLWDTAGLIYPYLEGRPRSSPPMKYTFASGASIAFTHLQQEDDKYSHQGAQYTWLALDEADHFTESQFWYVMSRVRSAHGVVSRVRLTFNANAGSWIKGMFAPWVDDTYNDPAKPGEVRWLVRHKDKYHYYRAKELAMQAAERFYPQLTDKELGFAVKSVTFIPATIHDNQILMQNDPSYLANLLAQSEVEQQRLLYSNWNIMSGQFFADWLPQTSNNEPWHVVPTVECNPHWEYYPCIDYGSYAPWAYYLCGIDQDGRIWVCREIYGPGLSTSEQAGKALALEQANLYDDRGRERGELIVRYADPQCFYASADPSRPGQGDSVAMLWQRAGMTCIPGAKDPIGRAAQFREYLKPMPDGYPALRVMDCCTNLIRTIPLLLNDENRPEIVDTKLEDHAYDAIGQLLAHRPMAPIIRHIDESLPPRADNDIGKWINRSDDECSDPDYVIGSN